MFFLGALLLEAVLHFGVPLISLITSPWTWLGAIPILVGFIVMVAGDRQLKQIETAISPFDRPSALVREGVFRISRNPMYLGMVLMLLGEAVVFGTVTPMLVPWIFAWVVSARFIRMEEAVLSEVFETEYEDYRGEVRRWL
jgi:protein-S-isoprenylcysteine O-methyltransferase Ste14